MTPIDFTDAELRAVQGWAGMAGAGFTYGPAEPDHNEDPAVTALKKVDDALAAVEAGTATQPEGA